MNKTKVRYVCKCVQAFASMSARVISRGQLAKVLNKGDTGEGGSRSSELHVGRELHVSHNCAGMGSVIGERGPGSNVGYWGGGGCRDRARFGHRAAVDDDLKVTSHYTNRCVAPPPHFSHLCNKPPHLLPFPERQSGQALSLFL